MFDLKYGALVVLALTGCSEGSDEGYCGTGFVDLKTLQRFGSGHYDGDLNVCLKSESPRDEQVFQVDLSTVSGRLTLDGAALSSEIRFPNLASVDSIRFAGCTFRIASFSALFATREVYLGCDHLVTREDALAVTFPKLETLGALSLSGQGEFVAPGLLEVESIVLSDLRDDVAVQRPVQISPSAQVVALRLQGEIAGLDALSLTSAGSLTFAGTTGDLASNAFPGLERIRSLVVNGAVGLTQCAVDTLLDQLVAPPDTVEIDVTLTQCVDS